MNLSRLILAIIIIFLSAMSSRSNFIPKDSSRFEWLPLAAYDSDIGIGAGFKGFMLNKLNKEESLDLIFFASSKGERWARLVIAIPDFAIRQRKTYDLALDLIIDYDLWINNNFFGIGMVSDEENRLVYSREPLTISLLASRAITEELVVSGGLRYRSIRNFHPDKELLHIFNDYSSGQISTLGWLANVKYDARDSYINPNSGYSIALEMENAPTELLTDHQFLRFSFQAITILPIDILGIKLATRLMTEWYSNDNVPLQLLIPLGGNRTLRGYPQDRFLDNSICIINSELRFPIYYRLGGIIGIDAGKTSNSISNISIMDWRANWVGGLRYYMDTFVVRGDVGVSTETFCVYLNIGHMF